MKNLIYQCYDGPLLPGHHAGMTNMKQYAARIGADYLFEPNTKFGLSKLGNLLGKQAYFYDCLKPVYDPKFLEYDNVLSADIDIFAVDGLQESIFDGFTADTGSCTEPLQPKLRAQATTGICGVMDEKWAAVIEKQFGVTMPRTPDGLLKVYNAGLELWSNRGLIKASENFIPFVEYFKLIKSSGLPGFYTHDQNYFHAMIKVAKLDHVELDNNWNCLIHHYFDKNKRKLSDPRTKDTKLVQIQIRSADHWDAETQWRIVNCPVSTWNLPQ